MNAKGLSDHCGGQQFRIRLEQYLVILGENQSDKRSLEMINQTERCYIKVGFDEWLPSGI